MQARCSGSRSAAARSFSTLRSACLQGPRRRMAIMKTLLGVDRLRNILCQFGCPHLALGRWREGAVLLALIILVSLVVLAAADAWMIIKDGAQRCGAQFPKWLGCVVANHESLSG